MSNLTLETRKFNINDYHQLLSLGIVREDESVELIRGEILEMSPV